MKTFNCWLNEQCGIKSKEANNCMNTVLDAYDEIYTKLRKCKKGTYVSPFSDDKEKERFLLAANDSTPDIMPLHLSGWIHRVNINADQSNINERFSLNAAPSVELIKDLDAFMKKYSSDVVQYKGREDIGDWECRHDSVTVYCRKIGSEMVSDMVKIASRHARKGAKNIPLTGRILAKGLSKDDEPTVAKVSALAERANKVCDGVFDDVFDVCKRKFGGKMSAGEYSVVKMMIDSYEKEKEKILPQSIEDYKLYNSDAISLDEYEKRNLRNVEECNSNTEKGNGHQKVSDFSLWKMKKGRDGR